MKLNYWIAIIIGLIVMFGLLSLAYSAEVWTDLQIVEAIFKAEGGYKATWLYGIRSVSYANEAEARQICFNTVRNNRVRYAEYGYKEFNSYLDFLGSRYCPIGCDNDRGTNRYWLSNVRYFLEKSK